MKVVAIHTNRNRKFLSALKFSANAQ